MSEREKQIAIAGGVILAALLLWLWMRNRRSSTVVNQSGDVLFGGVDIPGLFVPPGTPMIIPNFNSDNPMAYSAIGACCADCSKSQPRTSYLPASRSTFVYNAGNKGPVIHFHEAPAPIKPRAVASFDRWR